MPHFSALYRSFKIRWLFYRFTFLPNLLITSSILSVIWRFGWSAVGGLFWFKAISFSILAAYIESSRKKEMYFFYNHGLSRLSLWIGVLVMDLGLLLLLLNIGGWLGLG